MRRNRKGVQKRGSDKQKEGGGGQKGGRGRRERKGEHRREERQNRGLTKKVGREGRGTERNKEL
jgi:hypothetical protein